MDGYCLEVDDCNDNDPSINPGATEVCDGLDNDCDGAVDEGFDTDLDGVDNSVDNCPNVSNQDQADSDFGFLLKRGSYGTGDRQFKYPRGIAVDSSGNVYVADRGNHRIKKFDSS